MRRQLLFSVLLLGTASPAIPATPDATAVSLISIVVELKAGGGAQSVDPTHVFAGGDTVRFRLRPTVDSYLYVLDLNTSGKYEVLFPRPETGSDNRIEHGRDYLMPATQNGWFEVSGPAGYEKLYFMLSPVALAMGQVQNRATNLPPQGTAPSTMHPRCNDEVFKARGECLDPGAGPKAIAPGEALPRDLVEMAPAVSRDLKFTNNGSGTTVTSGAPLAGPVVYEFLLAHK
ncbi:MAG: DUF4384 domain-containing protein [Terracidiphilus sp.]|jgi:hypothetical protein